MMWLNNVMTGTASPSSPLAMILKIEHNTIESAASCLGERREKIWLGLNSIPFYLRHAYAPTCNNVI